MISWEWVFENFWLLFVIFIFVGAFIDIARNPKKFWAEVEEKKRMQKKLGHKRSVQDLFVIFLFSPPAWILFLITMYALSMLF
jgi:hypothetical protein